MRTKMPMLLVGGALLTLAACAYHNHHVGTAYGYAYDGGEWRGERAPFRGELTGPGVEILDNWLRETEEGQAIVTLGFRDAADGQVSEDVAHRANVWFRRYADENRDMRLTDPEIRTALVAAAGRYVR